MELAEDCVVNSVMVHSYFTSVKAGLWSLRHYIDWACKDERDLPLWETCLTAFYSSLGWIVKQRSVPQPIRVIANRIAEDKEVNVNNETLLRHFTSLTESHIIQLPETKVLTEDLRMMYERIYNGKYSKSLYEVGWCLLKRFSWMLIYVPNGKLIASFIFNRPWRLCRKK